MSKPCNRAEFLRSFIFEKTNRTRNYDAIFKPEYIVFIAPYMNQVKVILIIVNHIYIFPRFLLDKYEVGISLFLKVDLINIKEKLLSLKRNILNVLNIYMTLLYQ